MFRTTTSRLTSIVLTVGLIGLGAPLAGAGPETRSERRGGWSFNTPHFGKFQVRIGSPRQPEVRRPEFMVPCDLNLSAFQSGNTVIVVATGTNRESGFTTRFEACDLRDRTPEIYLINTRGHDHCAQVITAFEATGSFSSHRPISCIRVHVGHQVHDVRVVQAPCL